MPWVAGLAAAGSMGTGIAGALVSNNASKRASRAADAAAQRFYDFEDPNFEEMRLQLEELKQQGLLTPEMEQAILQDPSLMQNVAADPRLQKAEMDALETLARISSEGGMDAQGQLAYRQAESNALQTARGQREALMNQAAQRGQLGSGLMYVMQQQADQDAAQNANMMGMQQAAAANQRDLEALNQMASIGGNVTNRDLNLKMQKAQSQDAINRFNTTTRGDVHQRNVGARNTAAERNLGESQRIADQNVLLRNQAQQYNKALPQQQFENNMARAQGAAGLAGTQGNAAIAAGQNVANTFGLLLRGR